MTFLEGVGCGTRNSRLFQQICFHYFCHCKSAMHVCYGINHYGKYCYCISMHGLPWQRCAFYECLLVYDFDCNMLYLLSSDSNCVV